MQDGRKKAGTWRRPGSGLQSEGQVAGACRCCRNEMGDQARTQAAQNKMIKGEAEVKKLNQEAAAGQLTAATSQPL